MIRKRPENFSALIWQTYFGSENFDLPLPQDLMSESILSQNKHMVTMYNNRVFDHDGFSGAILKNQLKVARQEACLNNNIFFIS